MSNDGSNDDRVHPFGLLPEVESSMWRKLQMCIDCHIKDSDGDYLFVDRI